ncbi:hemerythrin domain-containing protein [Flavihumibacter rivuli]|uniref:hemerythrin domain-containing protein n=1 Tax=Flavihumibacter rivuli TaxID=2838156 RepID=UPI001BDE3A4D|nr:hemerythrin domain-containing protein [Flavihumibacter rivuli]ULQ57539.1 hemerythrin domain-containing protein [Flavihumibacter rivuli]
MQRAQSLQPLSRQHKGALMACLLIKKGVSKQAPVAVMKDFLLQTWEMDIAPHMQEEEHTLIPFMKSYNDQQPLADAILRDHELLRLGFAHLRQEGVSVGLIESLANLLEQHIRFEERTVFQSLQSHLNEEQLNKLQFHEPTGTPVCNSFPNHFWE